MASIDVVICATHDAAAVGPCLDAVIAQHPRRVWLVWVDLPEPAAGALSKASSEIEVLRAAGPGLAAARNAALTASTADVLAFIEDDVVVSPGWLCALQTAWDAAPERVGAIGGPIELRVPGAEPRWFSEGLHVSFATLDFGPDARTLDPAQQTLHGGNLSVRATALRALRGFFPQRGHRDGRDWFAEEHHAQRELAGAGWEVRYEPAAVVARVPADRWLRPGAVLRRRWRYGARMAVADRQQAITVTLSQIASSGAGAAVAAVRRRPALAVERAARVAQNVGALVGRPIVARDFRGTGPRPFGGAIPPPRPARRLRVPARSESATAAVLLYHRVAEPTIGSDGMCVHPDRFAEQLEQIGAQRVLDLAELTELARAKRVPAGALAVSFDDGYEDTLVNARPRLAAAGVPATVFVSTGHIARQRPFFWDALASLLQGPGPRPPQLVLVFPDGSRAWRTETPAQRDQARRQIHPLIQPADAAVIDDVLAQLASWAGVPAAPLDAPRAMTVDELGVLAADPLITIGAHTVDHTNLGFRAEPEQREEIEGSRADLRDWLGSDPIGFSYPFGIPGVDFHASTRRLVAAAGFRYAVANQDGPLSARSDPYAVPRYFVPDAGGDEFAQWLRAALPTA